MCAKCEIRKLTKLISFHDYKKKKIFFDKFTQIKVLKVTLQPIVFFVFSEPVKSKKITESVNLT